MERNYRGDVTGRKIWLEVSLQGEDKEICSLHSALFHEDRVGHRFKNLTANISGAGTPMTCKNAK
jgi:hypothetical protein